MNLPSIIDSKHMGQVLSKRQPKSNRNGCFLVAFYVLAFIRIANMLSNSSEIFTIML